MKVIVCGGRDYADAARVHEVLDGLVHHLPITEVIQGAARGADALAKAWAVSRGIPCVSVPAQWRKFGKQAGALRNTRMLKEYGAEAVIAFPGGRGTYNMVAQARAAGVRVIRSPA